MIATSRQWMENEQVNYALGKTYTQKVLVTRYFFLGVPFYTRRLVISHNM